MTDHPPILTPEQVAKVRVCAHLLEPPAADVVGELCDVIEALRARATELEGRARDAELRAHMNHEDWRIVNAALANAHDKVAEYAATIARLTQERDEARAIWDEVGQHIDRAAIGWNHRQIAEVFRNNRELRVAHRAALVRAGEAEAALATLREATTWQPMATAPKDGTVVLLMEGRLIACGSWNPGGAFLMPHWMTIGQFTPTHWMPLPTPPPDEPRG